MWSANRVVLLKFCDIFGFRFLQKQVFSKTENRTAVLKTESRIEILENCIAVFHKISSISLDACKFTSLEDISLPCAQRQKIGV